MKNRKRNTLWMLVSIILILTACGQRGQYDTQFARIDSLTDVHPDSALSLLQDIESKNTKMPTSARMRLELLRAQAMNKAFIDFTSDSLGLQLCKYYDHHGNANDQMKAYYLLGCAYRDLGDMPQALKNLHNAADRADTTRMDCDFKTLSMVYSQMCSLFNQEMLPNEQLETLDKAGKYALIAKDTLNAIVFYELRANAYEALGREDSISSIRYNASKMYKEAGFPDRASLALGPVIYYETKRGNLAQAKKLIDSYESESGAVDSMGNVLPSHLIFYYIKGNYWLAEGKRDSAEKYFRKEVALHNTNYHLMFGYKGLLDMFKQTQTRDSIAKYAQLSYEMKDSCYKELMSQGIQRMHANYKYSLLQEQTLKMTERSHRRGNWILALTLLLLSLMAMVIHLKRKKDKKFKEQQEQYYRDKLQLKHEQEDLLKLQRKEHQILIQDKNEAIRRLSDKIKSYEMCAQALEKNGLEMEIRTTPVYKHFKDAASKPKIEINNEDWQQLWEMLSEKVPALERSLTIANGLSNMDIRICLLTWLFFSSKEICSIMLMKPSALSNQKKRLHKKIFGTDASAKDFEREIHTIGR